MLYQFLKILVRIALKLFFKRIYISGLENIKPDRPQLVASNHPSGFMEPLIMACFFPKSLHFLVRGDVFDKKWLRPLLESTNQIPIFRFKDGFSRLRENTQTIDASTQVLLDNKNLLIFAEGSTQSIKKLRPLQKGIARIGFQALDKNPDLNLEILPVGINFTFSSLFNDEVMLKIGQPIAVKSYYNAYMHDKNLATEKLLHDTYQTMLPNVIHVEDQTQLPAFEELVLLTRKNYRIESPHPVHIPTTERLEAEITLANTFNTLDIATRKSLTDQVLKLKIHFSTKLQSTSDILQSAVNPGKWLILILGLMPALIGILFHALPLACAWLFMSAKVKQREFKSSILFVVSLVLTLMMYLIIVVLSIIFQWPWWILPLIVTAGLWARYYHRVWSSIFIRETKDIQNYTEALDNIYQTYLPSGIQVH